MQPLCDTLHHFINASNQFSLQMLHQREIFIHLGLRSNENITLQNDSLDGCSSSREAVRAVATRPFLRTDLHTLQVHIRSLQVFKTLDKSNIRAIPRIVQQS